MLQRKLQFPLNHQHSLKYYYFAPHFESLSKVGKNIDLEVSLGTMIGHNNKSELLAGSQMMDTRTESREGSKAT